MQEQNNKNEVKLPDNKENRVDKVGETGVYPVSEMEGASENAEVHPPKSFGQGERGAKGYEDSGTSEINYIGSEKGEGKASGS